MGLLRLVKQVGFLRTFISRCSLTRSKRKEESSWTLPPNLIMTLQSMLSQPAIERLRALQELIRVRSGPLSFQCLFSIKILFFFFP